MALAGIVVNNNIVLIDTYNYLRANNSALTAAEAVLQAAKSRFQSGDVDHSDTVVGLLPLANGYSVDIINRNWEAGGMVSSWWQPLASAIVNGLVGHSADAAADTGDVAVARDNLQALGCRVADHQFERSYGMQLKFIWFLSELKSDV